MEKIFKLGAKNILAKTQLQASKSQKKEDSQSVFNNTQTAKTNKTFPDNPAALSKDDEEILQNIFVETESAKTTEISSKNNVGVNKEIPKEKTSATSTASVTKSASNKTTSVNEQEVLLSQIQQEISKQKSEIQTKKDSKTGFGALADGVKGIFNKGCSGELSKINKLEEKFNTLLENPNADELNSLYLELFGSEPNVDEIKKSNETLQGLENGRFVLSTGNALTKQDVCDLLTAQGEQLEKYFENSVESQGLISKGLGFLNNIAGFGTTEKAAKAQIENYQNLVQELNNAEDSEEFLALYKTITGEDLTTESLQGLVGGESKVDNSKAAETIMDYESTQETALTTASSVVSGVVCSAAVAAAPLTGGASLALGAGVGAGLNVAIKGYDSASRANGESAFNNLIDYAKNDFLKDAALGAINGFSGTAGNALGKVVEKKAATALAGSWLGNKLTATTLKAGGRIAGEFLDGASDGAISNAGEYLIDCVTGDEKFNLKNFKDKTLLGAAMGGVMSVGMQEGMGLAKKGIKEVENIKSAKAIDRLDIGSETDGNINGLTNKQETKEVLKKLARTGNLPKDIDCAGILKNPTSVSKEFYDDLTKLYSACKDGIDIEEAFIPKYQSYSDVADLAKAGDVFKMDGSDELMIMVSNSGTIDTLNMSAKSYLELFPPVKRYASMQGNVGDCYLVSSLDLMLKTPETRANLLKCFSENADGSIDVKVGDAKISFKDSSFETYRQSCADKLKSTNMNGCSGLQMLEEAYGYDCINSRTQELIKRMEIFPDSNDYDSWMKQLVDLQNPNKVISDVALEARGNGGRATDVFKTFGLEGADNYAIDDNALSMLYKQDYLDNHIFALTSKGVSDSVFLNKELQIAGKHAYSAKPYLSNGKLMFEVTNPWSCANNLNLTLDEVKEYFGYLNVSSTSY